MANETGNGSYKFENVIMGSYKFVLNYKGHDIEFGESISIESDTTTTKDIYFQPASINGAIEHQNGTLAKGETVKLIDKASNEVIEKKTDENGTFEFTDLLPG
ncbi:MAG: hypothetical protein ACPL25_04380, partial [Ignavibacteria bacterium]